MYCINCKCFESDKKSNVFCHAMGIKQKLSDVWESTELCKYYKLDRTLVEKELNRLVGKDSIEACHQTRKKFDLSETEFGEIFIEWYERRRK